MNQKSKISKLIHFLESNGFQYSTMKQANTTALIVMEQITKRKVPHNQSKSKFPPNCHVDHKKYVVWRKQIKGKPHRLVLGTINDSVEQIWLAYNQSKCHHYTKYKPNTLDWLADKFFVSNNFKGLSKHTQGGHERGAAILDHIITDKNEVKHRLGSINVAYVKKPLINGIKEKRLNERIAKGEKGTGTINMELSFLSKLFSWGCNHVAELEIDRNPLEGLERLKVEGRTRYVTDAEYDHQYNLATPIMQCVFEVAYLTACRSVEIRNLKESDIQGNRLYIARRKGSKHNYIEMSPRLKAAIDRALSLKPVNQLTLLNECKWLFTTRNGEKMRPGTLTGAMTRLKDKMIELGSGEVYWSIHLLKHKGMTDSKDKNLAGLSETNKKIYDHEVPIVESAR